MFRDDKNAMVHQVDALSREAERLRHDNQAMRDELLAVRRGQSQAWLNIYEVPTERITPGQRAALSHHQVTAFPAWATAVLTFVTFGLFPLIHFGLYHDKLPRAAENDPNAGSSIGFSFIPGFQLYWVFFNSMRLADRLNLQLRLRGEAPSGAAKGLSLAASVVSVIPYINILLALPMWTIANVFLQMAANRVAALAPMEQPGTPPPSLPDYNVPPAGLLGP
jgi:hypothetical protein